MGKYVVKWNRSAYLQMISISVWYRENVALKAASSFISSVYKAIEQISSYPTIGMLDRKRSNARFKIIVCCYIRNIVLSIACQKRQSVLLPYNAI